MQAPLSSTAIMQAATTRALQESEESLNAIFDAGPDAMLISNNEGIIVLASRQVEPILGYKPKELLGQSIELLVPDAYRQEHAEHRNQYIASPTTRLMGQRREITARHKDGNECTVEIGLSQISSAIGVFVASSIRDIRDRKSAEDAVRAHAEKLRYLYELSPLGIVLTDMEGRYLEFNQAFEKICGYSAGELRALDYWQLTPRKYEDAEKKILDDLACTGHYGPYEKEYVRKDGTVVPLRLNGAQVAASNGEKFIWSIVEDISSRKQSEDKIRELAFFDHLTGLPNRALLHDLLRRAISSSQRSEMFGALLLIDLDNFKTINDTRGHTVGDQVLTKVAELLKKSVRNDDIVARLGGDEFVVVLVHLDSEINDAAGSVKEIAEKILDVLDHRIQLGNSSFQCTASIGASLFRGAETTQEDLIKQADLAMYRAKAMGRNTISFFDPTMEAAVLARATLEQELRIALDENQFTLYYQPQISKTKEVIGVEALIRWLHPNRGLVAPDGFIEVAEETGLILSMGHWVLHTACLQLSRWAKMPEFEDLTLAVNVSAHQFGQADFATQVQAILLTTGANPYRLKLELTESVLMVNAKEIAAKMSSLKSLGVGFSLDDFGTGYSSLSYLKLLPIDQLKIDRSFVRDVLLDPNDAAIARTIIALAHSLQLSVIAEGVETQDQQKFLDTAECDSYQGYLFSKPLPIDEFEKFHSDA
ncbi:cyclic di-GMP phosphodiesterase Gmr [Duganella sp. HH105]|nr:cyclic di-GMP phosphodiesterase Gmr [Duganella sp. HH105]